MKCQTPHYLPPWTVNNLVFRFDLQRQCRFNDVVCSKTLSYEPELFPAILISKWHPSHVTLFTNGKGMITGTKSLKCAVEIVNEVNVFLNTL